MEQNNVIVSLGSQYKKLISSDWLKAAITTFFSAAISSIVVAATPLFKDGASLPTWLQVKIVLVAGFSAGISAIVRKYFTNSTGQVFKKEPANITTVADAAITTGQ